MDDDVDTGGAPCGLNGRGTGDRLCVAGAWQSQGTCSNDLDVCLDDDVDTGGAPCGLNGRGTDDRTCVAGAWQDQGTCGNDPDECVDDATDTGGALCGLNARGSGDRTCVAGDWQSQDTCSNDPDECVDGATDTDGDPCGLNGRGSDDRLCVAGTWLLEGSCSNDPDECVDGAVDHCTECQEGHWTAVDCVCDAEDTAAPCNDCPEGTLVPAGFACVPAGTFMMGSPTRELYRISTMETWHRVSFTYNFAIGVTEVTQDQWQAQAGGMNPSFFTGCGDTCPVEQVDWYSTLAYANALSREAGLQECYTLTPPTCADEESDWVGGDAPCTGATFAGLSCTGYRLPTEAEWEYAYRAGTAGAYYSGNNTQRDLSPLDPNLDEIGWYGGNSWVTYSGGQNCAGLGDSPITCGTHPVGGKQPNDWGLHDMSGNVWEWTWDWYGRYPGPTSDYIGPPTGNFRVVRGGSWRSYAYSARAASRNNSYYPVSSGFQVGFRLARTLP